MNTQEALAQIVQGRNLSRAEAAATMRSLMTGEATAAQVGAFLTAMHMKGETVDEIAGFAETMRALATCIETARSPLVDTCGTGGSHSNHFNISTTAAFVLAGADVAVAKHGNRSATSQCGSADVLEALGVNIDATPAQVGKCIDEVGIGFLFARALHSAMKYVGPVRAELKIRTVFNFLGPLTNPAGADAQVMGVAVPDMLEPLANVLAQLGTRHAFVVSGSDGLDEVTLSGATRVAEAIDGAVRSYEVHPEQFGMSTAPRDTLVGGDARENAKLLLAVLNGAHGPHRDIVVLNAAFGIVAGLGAEDIHDGIGWAEKSIDSGKAKEKLEKLIKVSNDS
jgi:anthranilate phosphoribosyltransferase